MSLPLEAYVSMTESLLGLELSPAARAQVAANLANLRRLAATFEAIALHDDLDPAPVYRPHSLRQA